MRTIRQIPRISGIDPKIVKVLEPIRDALEQLTVGPGRALRIGDVGAGLAFTAGKLRADVTTTSDRAATVDSSDTLTSEITRQIQSLIGAQNDFRTLVEQQLAALSFIATDANVLDLDTNGYVVGIIGSLPGDDTEEVPFITQANRFGIVRPAVEFELDTAYALGDFVIPSESSDRSTGLIYEVTTAGTTDDTDEPNWLDADTPSDTIMSGTVEFTARTVAVVNPFIVGDVDGIETIGIDGAVIVDATIPYRAIEDAAALSVLGRAADSSGVLADIQAGSDHQVLRRSGTVVAFGAIDLSQSEAVGTSRLALANIVQVTGQAVLGVSTAGDGNLAAISAGTDDRVLRQTAGALTFGQLTAGMFPAAVVPDAALSALVLLLDGDGYLVLELEDYADDTAADAGGVPINGWYRTGNAVQVRLT